MLSLLAGAVLQTIPVASPPPADYDLRCMAAYLFAVGQITDDSASAVENRAGATAMVMYFFGKVRARTPALDIKLGIRRLVEAPDYLAAQLKPDLDRCGTEYSERGRELQAFGED